MKYALAEDPGKQSADRVRRSTAPEINLRIDERTEANIARYMGMPQETVLARLNELDREWDIGVRTRGEIDRERYALIDHRAASAQPAP